MQSFASLIWIFVSALASIAAIWLAARAVRWAKKGTTGGALLVALAFPNPDQPPPQQQVEEQTRRKKDSESGDPPMEASS